MHPVHSTAVTIAAHNRNVFAVIKTSICRFHLYTSLTCLKNKKDKIHCISHFEYWLFILKMLIISRVFFSPPLSFLDFKRETFPLITSQAIIIWQSVGSVSPKPVFSCEEPLSSFSECTFLPDYFLMISCSYVGWKQHKYRRNES